MKKLILMLMLMAPVCAFAQKFGHINAQQVAQDMPEYVQAMGDIQAKAKEFENEFNEMQQEFQTKYEAYEKAAPTMNETKKKEEEQSLMEMNQKLQQANQDYQQKLQQYQQEKLQPILTKLQNAIQSVGKAGGYVYVMDTSMGIPYISDTLSTDITSLVKAELKKQ